MFHDRIRKVFSWILFNEMVSPFTDSSSWFPLGIALLFALLVPAALVLRKGENTGTCANRERGNDLVSYLIPCASRDYAFNFHGRST